MKTSEPVDVWALIPNDQGTDQRLTVDATSGGVQFAAFNARTTHVLMTVEAAQLRFTLDSSAPTSTNGHVMNAGDVGIWPMSWIKAAKFIRTGETSATIHASPLLAGG